MISKNEAMLSDFAQKIDPLIVILLGLNDEYCRNSLTPCHYLANILFYAVVKAVNSKQR